MVIPNEGQEISSLQEETSPAPDHQTGQDPRSDHTGSMEQLTFSEQENQSTKSTQQEKRKNKHGSGRCLTPKMGSNTATLLKTKQVKQEH